MAASLSGVSILTSLNETMFLESKSVLQKQDLWFCVSRTDSVSPGDDSIGIVLKCLEYKIIEVSMYRI